MQERTRSLSHHGTPVQPCLKAPQLSPQPISPASLPRLASWRLCWRHFQAEGSRATGLYKMVGGNQGLSVFSLCCPVSSCPAPWPWDSLEPHGTPYFPMYFTAHISLSHIPVLSPGGCHRPNLQPGKLRLTVNTQPRSDF